MKGCPIIVESHMKTALPSFLTICLLVNACSPEPKAKPNLILIVADSLRHDVLGCYGGDASTPNIDRLAGNGALFERAYSTAPCTFPSSTSMLTGQYSRSFIFPTQNDPPENLTYYVSDSEVLLGETIRDIGYDAFYSVENGLAMSANNLQGFTEFRGYADLSPSEKAHVENASGIRIIGSDPDRHRSSKYEDMYGMLLYLLTVPREQHFLLLKWFFDPHAPYNPPEAFRGALDIDLSQLPREPEFYTRLRHFADATAFSREECVFLKQLYLAEVASVDHRVGFILKVLEHRDLLRNTIFVFTSDHGEFFGEHDRLHHGRSYFEPVVHVPLIISGPGVPLGKTIPDPVSLIKLTPMVKDLLMAGSRGARPSRRFRASLSRHTGSLHPIYMDRIANRFLDRYIDYDALLIDGYKLVTFLRDGKPVVELYNLTTDPEEQNDISTDAPEIVRSMVKSLQRFRQDCDLRLEENMGGLRSDPESERTAQKAREQMRALGYIK